MVGYYEKRHVLRRLFFRIPHAGMKKPDLVLTPDLVFMICIAATISLIFYIQIF